MNQISVTVTASSLSDGLRSVVSAVCRILDGTSDATASFAEEPGEFRWRLFRIDEETIRILILEFDNLWSHKPDADGKPIFDVQRRLRTFADAVYCGCTKLLEKHGRDGYKDQWRQHDFPDAEFDELRRMLEHQNRRRTTP